MDDPLMSTEGEPRVRGRVLNGYMKFIRKKWGNQALEELQVDLGIDLHDVMEEKWYPQAQNLAIQKWVHDTYGPSHMRKLGFSASTEVGIISHFAWIAGFDRVLDHGIKDFRSVFDFGNIEVVREDGLVSIRLQDLSDQDFICESWIGAFEGICSLTKTRAVVSHPRCQLKGEEFCEYVIDRQ